MQGCTLFLDFCDAHNQLLLSCLFIRQCRSPKLSPCSFKLHAHPGIRLISMMFRWQLRASASTVLLALPAGSKTLSRTVKQKQQAHVAVFI